MSRRTLPERASLEYLKKLAKERLLALRGTDPAAKLADAQLAVAREHGFASWRALKTEIDRRRAPRVAAFFEACDTGDIDTLRELPGTEPGLVRERNAAGATGLHRAVRHPDVLRLLIAHGADPNARDTGDNASPLHFAASGGHLESVRTLLDAGADVHGVGDVHKGEVIGWATREGNEAVIALLLERGARHHIFSAIALGDLDLVDALVDEDPSCLLRRRSRFENGQTPLHAALAPPDGLAGRAPQHALLQRLIELGADIEGRDDKGRTPLAVAMLRGDRDAMRVLEAAGAKEPNPQPESDVASDTAARAIVKAVPMLSVRDMRTTIRWYESIGFSVNERYEDDGELMFARVSLGKGELTFSPGGTSAPRDISLWFFTDDIQPLYQQLKARQLRVAHAALSSDAADESEVRFEEDLYEPFYGGRQFSIRDINGLTLVFYQPGRDGGAP